MIQTANPPRQKGLSSPIQPRRPRQTEGEKISKSHKDIVDDLGSTEGPMTKYLEPFKSTIDKKSDRDETLLHYILVQLQSERKYAEQEKKEAMAKLLGSAHLVESTDEGDSIGDYDEATEPAQLDLADWFKPLFQWVLFRHPHLLKTSNVDSKNLFQVMLTAAPACLEVIFWTMDLILLDEYVEKYCSSPTCASTIHDECNVKINPSLKDYIQDCIGEREVNIEPDPAAPNELETDPHPSDPCIHLLFPNHGAFVDSLKKINEKLVNTVKDILKQMQPSELFDALIRNFQLDESVKAVEKLVRLYRDIHISNHEVSGQPVGSKDSGKPSLHFAVESLNQSATAKDITLSHLRSIIEHLLYYDVEAIRTVYDEKTLYDVLLDYNGEKMDDRDAVVEMIKFHCIGHSSMTRHEKENYLYPKDREVKNIEFDVREESTPINKEYMLNLTSVTSLNQKYETILQYADLPPYPMEISKEEGPEKHRKPCTAYTDVFRWLHEKAEVQRILKLSVDDLDNPHTDKAIIKAIKGDATASIRVDEWDWAKRDMSSATIFAAAPDVETVNLYWSGNNAILQAWLYEDIRKLKELKTLKVIALPEGNETDDAVAVGFKEFHDKMVEVYPHVEVVEGKPKAAGKLEQPPGLNDKDGESTKSQHEWLKHIQTFCTEFKKYRPKTADNKEITPSRPVRIAFLDDGVKSDIPIQAGNSFYKSPNDSSFRQFWVAPGGHGTVMARFITKVCPHPYAELYTVRLNNAMVGSSKFTIRSCAEAIEWAMEKYDPDIISMSWSFNPNSHADEQVWVNRFKTAVDLAVTKNKIVFASLDDKATGSESEKLYPLSIQGVIRMGSATILGKPSDVNNPLAYDYVLPGEKVLDDKDNRHVNGSSVATAIAAGLAGLIIYCVDLRTTIEDGKLGLHARNRQKMITAFNKLMLHGYDKFPHPRQYFNVPIFPDKHPDNSLWKKQLDIIVISLGFE